MKRLRPIDIVYATLVMGLFLLTIWGLFDFHKRFPVLLAGQGVVLIGRGFWKAAGKP